jgi:hypothetical protein
MAEFYQKVKQEIEKGISNVSIRSKEVLENIKIKKQAESLEEQIENAKTGLGHMVYTMFCENNFNQGQIIKSCEVIAELEQLFKEKIEELSQLHVETGVALGKIYCNQCKSEIAEGSQYCGHCGKKAPEPLANEE